MISWDGVPAQPAGRSSLRVWICGVGAEWYWKHAGWRPLLALWTRNYPFHPTVGDYHLRPSTLSAVLSDMARELGV